MKIYIFIIAILCFPNSIYAEQEILAEGLNLSPDDPAFHNPQVILTEAEKADPPPGEIRKQYLREVNEVREALAVNLAAAPAGAEGQQSPWMAKFQAIKANLDTIAVSRLQRDVIALIPKLKEIFESGNEAGYNDFFNTQGNLLLLLRVGIVEAISEHVQDQAGNVKADDAANFALVFSDYGFIGPSDWEDAPPPIDAAGVLILDPESVTNQLKALPWKKAQDFLSGRSSTEAFEDYETLGKGLAVLKTKYSTSKTQVVAKWNELSAWVAQQKAANP